MRCEREGEWYMGIKMNIIKHKLISWCIAECVSDQK